MIIYLLIALALVLTILFSPPVVWLYFLAVMNLRGVQNSPTGLPPPVADVRDWILAPGYLIDCGCNLTYATWIFREFPRELTVSARLKRHRHAEAASWRRDLAESISATWLDRFDPSGRHV